MGERETFRLKHTELDRSDLGHLSTTFLIIKSENGFGRVADWRLTERALFLLDAIPEDVEIEYDELDAFLTAGTDAMELPSPDEEWQIRELEDVDLADRTLGVLRNAGLIEAVNEPTGHSNTWVTTERLVEINELLEGLVHE
ncbi:hypothetical protein AArcSl_1304 [Halalkaliarchaeum desulfuricum]|uniref:Uncharacterized protein n=2 Tax=Halalkaliarchaeum desulfuricum TaxID=2055893 RepID=A0A343TIL3_9EURY|nr:hypothetical protein AArcSl_1304 [Halalkaliarchaeum desulfuricum]